MSTFPAGVGLLLSLLVPVTGLACDLTGGENCSDYRIKVEVSQLGPVFASKGDAIITESDIDAYLAARVRPDHFSPFLMDPDRIGKMLGNLVTPRQLARLAIGEDLHRKPDVQARMLQGISTLLADEYIDAYVERKLLDDYEAVAREDFLRSDRKSPAKLDFTQILIIPEPDGLLETMREVVELADRLESNPSAFDDLVSEHSDDPALEDNQGRYQDVSPAQLVDPVREALLELEPGEISGVVQSEFGLHILRLEGFEPEKSVEFEDVRERMLQQARDDHRQLITGRLMAELDRQDIEIAEGAVRELLERYDSDFGAMDRVE